MSVPYDLANIFTLSRLVYKVKFLTRRYLSVFHFSLQVIKQYLIKSMGRA